MGKIRMNEISPIIMAAGMLTMSSIILTPFALTFHMNEILTIEFNALIYAILFSIICSFIAYIIFYSFRKCRSWKFINLYNHYSSISYIFECIVLTRNNNYVRVNRLFNNYIWFDNIRWTNIKK